MTSSELISYYSGLLILQYLGKPRAKAHVEALVTPAIMDQLPFSVRDAFSVDTAIGVQLDVIGKYVGVSRSVYTFTGLVILTDPDYRLLIKMKVIQNNASSSLADIQSLLYTFFPASIRVFDYQNMHMDYFFDSSLGSVNLAEVFVRQGLLPKPMGVQLGSLIYAADISNMFGFRSYPLPGSGVSGFNSYTAYSMTAHWLSYTDAISG